jgi:hypothetical protein
MPPRIMERWGSLWCLAGFNLSISHHKTELRDTQNLHLLRKWSIQVFEFLSQIELLDHDVLILTRSVRSQR